MLTLVPSSWFSWDFRVFEDGRPLTVIDRTWFRERGSFTLAGETFHVRRTSVLRGAFVLEAHGRVLAEASKPNAFRRRIEITCEAERYVLQAVSAVHREFQLLRDDNVMGSIRPVSFIGRTATAQLPPELPREMQLFVIFLVLVLWKRDADAASSG